MNTIRIPLPYVRHIATTAGGPPDMVMFGVEEYDEADNVMVVVTAMMSVTKFNALGRPSVTEIELQGE